MKLIEKKDRVPASFVTTYISNAWEQIGMIQSDIDSIKNEFKDIKVVEECLQEIMDAYLLAAGRLQNYLDNKEHISIEDQSETKTVVKEDYIPNPKLELDLDDMDEDVNIDTVNINTVEIDSDFPTPDINQNDIEEFNKALNQTNQPNRVEHGIKPYEPVHYNKQNPVDISTTNFNDDVFTFDEMPEPDNYSAEEMNAMMEMLNKR